MVLQDFSVNKTLYDIAGCPGQTQTRGHGARGAERLRRFRAVHFTQLLVMAGIKAFRLLRREAAVIGVLQML